MLKKVGFFICRLLIPYCYMVFIQLLHAHGRVAFIVFHVTELIGDT